MAADYMQGFPMLVNECLKDAGLSGDAVDLVLLTGGHSQWYFVREQLCGRLNQFGAVGLGKIQADPERIILVPRPQETVALGLVYGPLAREVRFAGKDKPEITPELEKARVRVTETLQQVALKNREKTDSHSGQEWSEAEQMAQYYGLEFKPDSAGKLSRASGSGSNTESEVWDESMRVLPVTPEEEFEFREVGGAYEVGLVADSDEVEVFEIESGYEVEDYLGDSEIVSIPSLYNGKPVVAIGSFAFNKSCASAEKLKQVEIPGSCMVIGRDAFTNDVDELEMNDQLEIIGGWENDQMSLERVILHEGLKIIGTCAFSGNTEIRSIALPESVRVMGETALACCDIRSITIPPNLRHIRTLAFGYNYHLSEVIVSSGGQIEEIDEDAFIYSSVKKIKLPARCKCEKLIRRYDKSRGFFTKTMSAECITIERY